jgi:hypothetical protein
VGMVVAPWDLVQRLRDGNLERVFQDGVEEDHVGTAGMLFDLLHAEQCPRGQVDTYVSANHGLDQ